MYYLICDFLFKTPAKKGTLKDILSSAVLSFTGNLVLHISYYLNRKNIKLFMCQIVI